MECRITIKSHLDPSWSEWFDGLIITNRDDGTAVLEGAVIDQAALYGVLIKLRDLGVALIAVQCEDRGEKA